MQLFLLLANNTLFRTLFLIDAKRNGVALRFEDNSDNEKKKCKEKGNEEGKQANEKEFHSAGDTYSAFTTNVIAIHDEERIERSIAICISTCT